jgi:hypothetical protein
LTETTHPRLRDCLERYRSAIPGLDALSEQLAALHSQTGSDAAQAHIDLYEQAYPLLERALWSGEPEFHPLLQCYQALFREQDALIRKTGEDNRRHFILGIPVADRPHHLRACLESIYQICRLFGYGGTESGRFDRIKIVVAEDSRDRHNVARHIELVNEYREKGLDICHLGQDEQYQLLQAVPQSERELLGNILTTQPAERFYLKGQAANRNLCYLKFLQLTGDRHNTLYYLVDSDQSFCVNRATTTGDEVVYALNYFHYIDRIFRATDTQVLTGKLVGDPPVSPSVMAANFLDDVIAFFTDLAQTRGERQCLFHGLPEQRGDDAAYHDMAGLFGFENKNTAFAWRCPIDGDHNHAASLRAFAQRLGAFFFGEHPTRKTLFSYADGFEKLAAARTIYPGNYIVNYAGLKHIIPFGHLRLRMSGPTAGRLIRAEIGSRFASVNLPMLHRRTTREGLSDDFRPGVELQQERVDLSDEFERQFFGDLMLFSTAELVTLTDVNEPFPADITRTVIERKEAELLSLYQQKHEDILRKNRHLNDLVFGAGHWWLYTPDLAVPLRQIESFIENIEHNLGDQSQAWQQIRSQQHRERRKQQIVAALLNYRTERDAWDRLF